MGFLFKTPSMPAPPPVQPLPEPPKVTGPSEDVAAREEKVEKEIAKVEKKRKGRKSTILTSPRGLLAEPEELEKKTLLGS